MRQSIALLPVAFFGGAACAADLKPVEVPGDDHSMKRCETGATRAG